MPQKLIYLFVSFFFKDFVSRSEYVGRIMRLLANCLLERVWREDVGPNFVYISFTTSKSTNPQRRNNYIYRFQISEKSENKNWGGGVFRV
jgi:hypothetical protein